MPTLYPSITDATPSAAKGFTANGFKDAQLTNGLATIGPQE